MKFSEQQISNLAPKPAAFKAGKKLASLPKWDSFGISERAMWGEIRGSGSKPYKTQIDIIELAYKCSCPSRQFPCKHSLGLMLLHAQHANEFKSVDEPEWVNEWISKRQAKAAAPPKEEKEYSPAELEKLEKAKQQRADARMMSVKAGVNELELWLKDLIRMGYLHLPSKSITDFEKVAARMVDAKAPGLAGWVKGFGNLNYSDKNAWQDQAMVLTGKLNLLIQTFKNYDQLDSLWQLSIRNLLGWNQSTKDLQANKSIKAVKDEWLVISQEREENDDLIVERNWLMGISSKRAALILNFGNRFSPLTSTLSGGLILQAELKFFPNVFEQRAIVQNQRTILPALTKLPEFEKGWAPLRSQWRSAMQVYPWINNLSFFIEKVQIVNSGDQYFIVDQDRQMEIVHPSFDERQLMSWVVISGNGPINLAGIYRQGAILPMGIFDANKYMILEKEKTYVERSH